MIEDDEESEEIVQSYFADDNAREIDVIDVETWNKMIYLASQEGNLFDDMMDSIILHYTEDDRPKGQEFKLEEKRAEHGILQAVSVDGKIRLYLSVKNHAAYFAKKQEIREQGRILDSKIRVRLLMSALNGTEEDWKWAKEKFANLIQQAKWIEEIPRQKSPRRKIMDTE